jgi:hypothetical protein
MKTWFENGLPLVTGDEHLRAINACQAEGVYLVADAIEILLDQTGEKVPVAEAIWVGDLPYMLLGERRPRQLCNLPDDFPGASEALKHITVSTIELNRWVS